MKHNRIHLKIVFALLTICLLPFSIYAEHSSDWISDRTIAAVVKLGKVYDYFIVEGMPDNYIVSIKYDTPDFGGGYVTRRERVFQNIGSGVIVSPNGWVFSNAHVANDMGQFGIEIQVIKGADGRPIKKNGVSIKGVAIPVDEGYMWVSMTKEEDLKNNIRRSSLDYLARVIYVDSTFMDFRRDRAVLKIVAHAKMNLEDNLPEPLDDISKSKSFPYVVQENPFDVSIRDPRIRSIGFPGIGPKDFPTITTGEYQGPESNQSSHILHTAFIAGGNSGGGLFYKDKLIGINTWSKPDPGTGRSISSAQPITYWGYPIAAVRLWENAEQLPDIPVQWLNADPSKDSYKNRVYAGFNILSRSNEAVKVKNTGLLVFKKGVDITMATQYIEFEKAIKTYYGIKMALARGVTISQIASRLEMDYNTVNALAAATEEQFNASLSVQQKQFLKILTNNEFYSAAVMIDNDGQAVISVPPDQDYKLAVVFNAQKIEIFDFTSGHEVIQGPWTIKVEL
jgi:trypsin-like peptidase